MKYSWRQIAAMAVLPAFAACGESRGGTTSFTPASTTAEDEEDDDAEGNGSASNDDEEASGDAEAETSEEDEENDDENDDGNSSTSSGVGGNASEYLTTEPPPPPTTDPTNSSADTNATGASSVDFVPEDIIDDLEDGDAVIYEENGRIGVWYTYADTSSGTANPPPEGIFVPTSGGPGESKYSAHVKGTAFTEWGAGIGFDINNSGGPTKKVFDASDYSGIAFQVRNDVALRFNIQTASVVPRDAGGSCTAGDSCNDAYGIEVPASTNWRQMVVDFSELAQQNWGQQASWDATEIMGFQWQVPVGQSFEFAIDDVGFF